MTRPSGAQFAIGSGDQRAVVVEVGGGLRSYFIGDRSVVDGYSEDAMADGARGQTLAPWPNRVRDGQWSWQGTDLQLALTEPEQHNAIHGLARWLRWRLVTHTNDAVSLECTVSPQPGYPWTVEVRNDWSIGEGGLSVRTTVTNHSSAVAPIGVGFHPYLAMGPTIDGVLLTVPADTRLLTGEQQIPIGSEAVAGTGYDFRTPRRVGQLRVDHTFTGLHRDDDGRCAVRLAHPETGDAVELWVDEAYPYLVIFTGDSLPDERRRRQGLAVEPMTMPPNGLVTGEGVVVLEPEQQWVGRWGIVPG
jgi:aldose 1-epimerase